MAAYEYRVNKQEALRYLGYSGQNLDDLLDERVDQLIAQCEAEASPGFVFRCFSVEHGEEGVHLKGSSLLLTGESIREHLAGASECAVMACTLGLANEQGMRRLAAKSSLDACVYGAAGSSLVESVADAAEAAVAADAAARGLHTNFRFSPGYGDLPLALQPDIVRVLQADKRLGLSPTESCMLIPTKSVTALIGLFPAGADQKDIKRTCAGCACFSHCGLRKAKTPCYIRKDSHDSCDR